MEARSIHLHLPKNASGMIHLLSTVSSFSIPAMGIDDILKDKREEIRQIAARHGAHNLRVFGSVARGEADEHSDIDFLVEMEPGRSLLDLGSLMIDLKALLGRTVDIVCEDSIYWLLRRRILKEAQPL